MNEEQEQAAVVMLDTLKRVVFMMRDGPIFPRDCVYQQVRDAIKLAEEVGIKGTGKGY